jgi:hypothetical protein
MKEIAAESLFMPNIVLDTGDGAVNQTKVPVLLELIF